MFKHILVPTDGSPLSLQALEAAAAFAREYKVRVTVLNVQPEDPVVYAGLGAVSNPQITQELHARLTQGSQEILAAAEALFRDAGVPCETMRQIGNRPYAVIIDAAASRACDLIFMASHGRHGVGALLLGSETQKVLANSKIPVLVYR